MNDKMSAEMRKRVKVITDMLGKPDSVESYDIPLRGLYGNIKMKWSRNPSRVDRMRLRDLIYSKHKFSIGVDDYEGLQIDIYAPRGQRAESVEVGRSGLTEAIELLEGLSLMDRIIRSPSAYGSVSSTLVGLKDFIGRTVPDMNSKGLEVFRFKRGEVTKFVAITGGRAINKMKQGLTSDSPLIHVGHILPPRRRGQKATWLPKR
ncbi:hypothetical protein CL629_02285 [bacterium]|nr:hypothetical protein [bacterium]|tara:strand:- start:687 stop:1301 length:615 start_codon:yes stop_codon:yes gene_type:complete